MSCCIGINIDGTNITGGIVTDTGQMLVQKQYPTPVKQGGLQILQKSIALASELLENSKHQIEGIGIGTGGQIDSEKGIVYSATNVLPGWSGLHITEAFTNQLGLTSVVDNDVNVMAIGEAIFGEAIAFRNNGTIIFLFLDAGVGGALLSDGSIHHGASWSGGEFGQMYLTIDPYARRGPGGSVGTLEAYCSTSGLVQTWQEITGNTDCEITAKNIIADAMSNPEGESAAAIAKTGEYLGHGLASLLSMVNPHAIIVGGVLSNLGEALLAPAKEVLQKRNLLKSKPCSIVTSKLGSGAAIIGAASLAMLKTGMLEAITSPQVQEVKSQCHIT